MIVGGVGVVAGPQTTFDVSDRGDLKELPGVPLLAVNLWLRRGERRPHEGNRCRTARTSASPHRPPTDARCGGACGRRLKGTRPAVHMLQSWMAPGTHQLEPRKSTRRAYDDPGSEGFGSIRVTRATATPLHHRGSRSRRDDPESTFCSGSADQFHGEAVHAAGLLPIMARLAEAIR